MEHVLTTDPHLCGSEGYCVRLWAVAEGSPGPVLVAGDFWGIEGPGEWRECRCIARGYTLHPEVEGSPAPGESWAMRPEEAH